MPAEQKKIKRTTLAKWFSQNGYEEIAPMDYYRFMFPEGELAERAKDPRAPEANTEWKYNAIVIENTHKTKDIVQTKKDNKGNVIVSCPSQKEVWYRHIVLDDLKKIESIVNKFGKTESEFYMAPNSYLGRTRTMKTERYIYACIIEVDHPKTAIVNGHREQVGMKQLIHDWTTSSIPYLMPSACVCSGTGIHLVYFLDRPYQLTDPYQKQQWDNFRKKFTKRIWNRYVTKETIQYENHCQTFRIVGTRSKKHHLVEAFWLSKKRYTIDELFSQVKYDEKPTWSSFEECIEKMDAFEAGLYEPDELMKMPKMPMIKGVPQMSERLLEAKEKWPEWFQERIVEKKPKKIPGGWSCNRGLYDWYVAASKENAEEGCRYNRVHALAEMAVKCDIPFDEFNKDAFELYNVLKQVKADDPFKYIEFVKARDEYFNPLARRSTRDWIEKEARIPMNPPAKRNKNKRKEHLQAQYLINPKTGRRYPNPCRGNREAILEDMRANGEITGRPDKQSIIKQWRQENPNGKKADCIRETGLTKPTVYKWWDA
jgi:hypothetical protein